MDLSTTYMGLKLRSPLVPSASPLSEHLDNIQRMEDAGAGAVVLHSLFQEQLEKHPAGRCRHQRPEFECTAEPLALVPDTGRPGVGPEEYLEHLRKAKQRVSIPIIASLNGASIGRWTQFASEIQQAGADALELNIYYVPTDPGISSEEIEQEYADITEAVKTVITIPLAVKMTPFLTNPARMAKRFVEAGARGLALFNRYNMPDIELEMGGSRPRAKPSSTQTMRLPLRWISILHGRVGADLAATGGIYTAKDALKMLLVGARVVHVCSLLLTLGVEQLRVLEKGMRQWMEEHGHKSVSELEGKLSHLSCSDTQAFERAQYLRVLRSLTV